MTYQRHTNRNVFTMFAMLAGFYSSACDKKEGESPTNTASAPAITAGNTTAASEPSPAPVSPPAPGAADHPMPPGMKMGPGMEDHAQKHDGGHP